MMLCSGALDALDALDPLDDLVLTSLSVRGANQDFG